MNNFTVGMLSDSELLSGISTSMQLHAALAVVAETAKRSVCRRVRSAQTVVCMWYGTIK